MTQHVGPKFTLIEFDKNSHYSAFDQLQHAAVTLTFNNVFLYSAFSVLGYEFAVNIDGLEAGIATALINDDFTVNPFDGNVGLTVKTEFRGQGIASSVVKALIPLFKFHNLTQIMITYDQGNTAIETVCTSLNGTYFDTVQSPKVRFMIDL